MFVCISSDDQMMKKWIDFVKINFKWKKFEWHACNFNWIGIQFNLIQIPFNSNNIYWKEMGWKWDVQGIEIFLMIMVLKREQKPFKRHKYEKETKFHSFSLGNWLNKFQFGTPKDNFWQIVPYVILLNLGFALLGTTNDNELINWWEKNLFCEN